MPKPTLIAEQSLLEQQIIETLQAGLKQWRPNLSYPESYSDMQACVRGLIIAFDVKRRPLPSSLKLVCGSCEGIGHLVLKAEGHYRELRDCEECKGRGYTLGE
jgi:hypothetical protein